MIWLVVVFAIIIFIALARTSDENVNQSSVRVEPAKDLSPVRFVDHSREGGTYVPLPVVGIQFRSFVAIERARKLVKYEPMKLEAEPENPHDPKAIKVLTSDGFHVGYLRHEDADKLVDVMDSYVDCYVADIFGSKDITLRVLPFFRKESPMLLSWLINHWDEARDIYEKKYSGFNEQSILAESLLDDYCDYIKDMYLQHQDDAFLEYLYAKILFDKQQYDESSKLFMDLINGKRLIKVEEVVKFSALSDKAADLKRDGLLSSTLKKWFADADLLMTEEKYYEAANLFLDCLYLGMHQQSLPRKICKCYEEAECWSELHQFAEMAYHLPWISESTQDYLLKRN